MATRSPMRILTRTTTNNPRTIPLLHPHPRPHPHPHLRIQPQPQPQPQPQRPFFTLPSRGEPQVLTASARIPHHHAAVYARIADIDSYAAFLPYCKAARVTAWTEAADPASGRRWPARADLTAGWGGFEETYSSRVFCAPGIGVVEAVSGIAGRTALSAAELAAHGLRDPGPGPGSPHNGEGGGGSDSGNTELFRSLVTRWTVTPVEPGAAATAAARRDWTDVRLDIKFLFENPLYGAVSSAVADKLAPVMVKAFVEQAERVLKQQPPGKF